MTGKSANLVVSDTSAAVWSVQRIVSWSSEFLADKGTETPRLDAELLLCSILKCKRIQLYMNFDKPVTISERDSYKALLRRRASGEPIAYILGEKEFMGLSFAVDTAVLIPRPDTEVLVETALEFLKGRRSREFLEIGAGSGCISISLAKMAQAGGVAWDISEAGLAVAMANARRHEVEGVRFEKVDALEPASWMPTPHSPTKYDLIISNPPYIAPEESASLPASVRDYEPALALFAGDSGLCFYRSIGDFARDRLKPDGKLMFEIGWKQGPEVVHLLEKQQWADIEVIKDLAGRDRVVTAGLYLEGGPT